MDSNKIKKGLGRGLSSLIGETKSVTNINKLLISDLVSNKFQPRKRFDEENLLELSNSFPVTFLMLSLIFLSTAFRS